MTLDLTRQIIGIENRTAQEVFDIMSDRIRAHFSALPAGEVGELVAELRNETFRNELQHLRSSVEIDRLFQQAATARSALSAEHGEMEQALEWYQDVKVFVAICLAAKRIQQRWTMIAQAVVPAPPSPAQAATRRRHLPRRKGGDRNVEFLLASVVYGKLAVSKRPQLLEAQPVRLEDTLIRRSSSWSSHVSSVPDRRPRGRNRYGLHRLRAQQRCGRRCLPGTSPACLRPISSSAPCEGAYLIRVIESKRTFFSYEVLTDNRYELYGQSHMRNGDKKWLIPATM